ncbi:hypothetical protein QN277_007284 [Acacia crassicarpa]|uniref:Uncharacterized protein n=1 Tax=Acacia crassicarpa TaxID=499986 RepID=A0AAE1IVN9_9FABA|nr:hypothetical protein QN277_007284 [Acacia crassicarpa]
MARFLCRTLLRHGRATAASSSSVELKVIRPCFSLQHHRYRSSKASKPELIQIELGSSSASSTSSSLNDGEYELALRRFDELIQRILVKKATPDWLPFVPGSSFWVPPRASSPGYVVDLVQKLTNDLSDEEYMSITSLRGWPCSNFFIKEENESAHVDADVELNGPEEMGVRVKVKVLSVPENVALSEDEET